MGSLRFHPTQPLCALLPFLLLVIFQSSVCFKTLDPDLSDFEANNNLKLMYTAANYSAPPSPDEFSHYIFAVQWVASICSQPDSVGRCKSHLPKNFTIRGLWPAYKNGSYMEYCIDRDIIPPPSSYKHENEKLWADNWHKHGTCSGLSQPQYFGTALDLVEKVDVLQRFVHLGFTPDSQKMYNPSTMISEFYEKYKVRIKVVCVKKSSSLEMIGEIHFRVNKDATTIESINDGDALMCETTSVLFPDKY
ncbi:ribonuclease T2 [Ranunculus cassubicifolius]